jgi:ABC-type transport system involved in cytochrome c biogenesis permease subunit
MVWLNFPLYANIIFVLWALASILFLMAYKYNKVQSPAVLLASAGVILLGYFIVFLWLKLDRPPLRTLGETRLWYSFLLPVVGIIIYMRWKYVWFIIITLVFSALFLMVNVLNPEIHDKALMPALQSVWFVPHVIVYILGYVLLSVSSLLAAYGLFLYYFRKSENQKLLSLADNLVYIGFAFLTLGLLFGALWAKEAWGHYWTWDPKETWAFLTWMGYLIYMHYRYHKPKLYLGPLWTLSVAFIVLLIAWFGVNYLPSAQNSVHVYGNS